MTLDDLRTRYPTLGFALYAMTPGGPVTLETFTPDGQVFRFDGPTAGAAIEKAFPPEEIEPPEENVFD